MKPRLKIVHNKEAPKQDDAMMYVAIASIVFAAVMFFLSL